MAADLVCPSCGASIPAERRFDTAYTCEFCGNTAYFEQAVAAEGAPAPPPPPGAPGAEGAAAAAPAPVGAPLADVYSRFALGRTGSVKGSPFTVAGRIVFEYDEGFWSEWILQSAQDVAWLHEDEGVYVLFNKREIVEPLPPMETFRPGASVEWNRMPRWFITEVRKAKIVGVEGSVPNAPPVGKEITYVDGLSGGRVASMEVDLDGQNPELTVGIPLEYEEITLDGEEQANW